MEDELILTLPTRILGVYIEASIGFSHLFSPGGLNNTLLSQDCILENGSHCENGGRNVHSKDRGGGEGPVAWIQLMGQPAVMFFGWPAPTIVNYNQDDDQK